MGIKNMNEHKILKKKFKPNMTDLQMLGNSFWPGFDVPKI